MSLLAPELRAWLRPGLAGVIAVADDAGPEIVRVWAVRPVDEADEAPDVIEVYVQRAAASRLVDIVGESGCRGALNVVDVASYRSHMFKGSCTPLDEALDHAFVEAFVVAQSRAFAAVGLPVDAANQMLSHGGDARMIALRMKVDSVFDQSPGPGAGARL